MSPWQSYRRIATNTAQPGQLVLMLYDGAIRFLNQARQGFKLDDPLEHNLTINNNVLRAQAIISELNASLNVQEGGELAVNLRRLYEYLDFRLMESNCNKTEAGIAECIERLTVLREAWAAMLRKQAIPESMPSERAYASPPASLA